MRGRKHSINEGGFRIPFLIRWSGHVKAGGVDTENVCSYIDWMPTFSAIAGVEDLPDRVDGEDVFDIWLGGHRARSKPLNWRASSTPMREGRCKLHLRSRGGKEIELYDLSIDPSESLNVAEKHPDVVARMTAKLEPWGAELSDEYKEAKGRRN